jgi:hypothetical protein
VTTKARVLTLGQGFTLPLDAVTAFLRRGRATADGCYEWTGNRFRNGYGRYFLPGTRGRKAVLVHRLAFAIATGEWPPVVRHTCDNKPCFAREHLIGGTSADNVADRVARGRSAFGDRNGSRTHPEALRRGEHHGMHRLTAEQVAAIRCRYKPRVVTQRSLADEFRVSVNTIERVLRGEWG